MFVPMLGGLAAKELSEYAAPAREGIDNAALAIACRHHLPQRKLLVSAEDGGI